MTQLIISLAKSWQNLLFAQWKSCCRLDEEHVSIYYGAPIIEDLKPEEEVKDDSVKENASHHVTISAKESRSRAGDAEEEEANVHVSYSVS